MTDSQDSHNFKIVSEKIISTKFLERNIRDFDGAANFVKHLPFRRNANKNDLISLFTENCGTCGTKHALLKQLAIENSIDHIKLKLGIFKMQAQNAPAVTGTLAKYKLDYMPEAHNYLTIGDEIVDCTWSNSGITGFKNYLLNEIEIEPAQITDFKVKHHKTFLEQWLKQTVLPYSIDDLWAIREECIAALSN